MISRCITEAQRIAALPVGQWAAEVLAQPEVCPHADCSPSACCRVIVRSELKAEFSRRKCLARYKRADDVRGNRK